MATTKKPRWPLVAGMVIGGSMVYFLDPDKGGGRRQKLGPITDRVGQVGSQAGSFGQTVTTVKETVTSRRPDNPNPDDNTLRDRVESEVFRDPSVPKGDININVVDGFVELRGELKDQSAIDKLVEQVQRVGNVRGVHNFLHVPGTPAPNKESAIEAS